MTRCEPCDIALSPLAYKRHFERDHALDRCPIASPCCKASFFEVYELVMFSGANMFRST